MFITDVATATVAWLYVSIIALFWARLVKSWSVDPFRTGFIRLIWEATIDCTSLRKKSTIHLLQNVRLVFKFASDGRLQLGHDLNVTVHLKKFFTDSNTQLPMWFVLFVAFISSNFFCWRSKLRVKVASSWGSHCGHCGLPVPTVRTYSMQCRSVIIIIFLLSSSVISCANSVLNLRYSVCWVENALTNWLSVCWIFCRAKSPSERSWTRVQEKGTADFEQGVARH